MMNHCVDELMPDFAVDCRGSDKCLAKIRHPVVKVWVYLGTFSTPEEARDVCSRKKLEYESCSVQELDVSLATNSVTDYENHPGIKRLQRGKWGAVIRHNMSQVSLGRYDTPSEAAYAYNLSKLELESQEMSRLRKGAAAVYSTKLGMPKVAVDLFNMPKHELDSQEISCSRKDSADNTEEAGMPKVAIDLFNMRKHELDSQEISCSRKDSADYSKEAGMPKACFVYQSNKGEQKIGCMKNVSGRDADTVNQDKSRKRKVEMQLRKIDKKLSTFDTAEALIQKKYELGVNVDAEQNQSLRHAYPRSGRWRTEIRHPITKARIHLGTFDTAEEAQEAYYRKRREFDLMLDSAPAPTKCKQSNDSCDDSRLNADAEHSEKSNRRPHAYQRKKSGQWRSGIKHPSAKNKKIHLGTFDKIDAVCVDPYISPGDQSGAFTENAEETHNSKMDEFDLMLDSAPSHTKCKQSNDSDHSGMNADAEHSEKSNRRPHAYQKKKSGRWTSEIRHPSAKNKKIHLGTFDTAKQAEEAYNRKRQEFDLMIPGHKTRKQSNNSNKIDAVCVDPYISPAVTEDAEETHSSKMDEFDLMPDSAPSHTKCKQSNDSCDADTDHSEKSNRRPHAYYSKKSGRWVSEIRHPSAKNRIHLGSFDTAKQAEEAYNKKRREFDLMFPGDTTRKQSNNRSKIDAEEAHDSEVDELDLMGSDHEKRGQLKARCEADEIGEGRSDPNCASEDLSVSSNGSSVIKAGMVAIERTEELDLGVIDSYGRLIGEYSSLDDELWIC